MTPDEIVEQFPGAELIEEADPVDWPSPAGPYDEILAELTQAASALVEWARSEEPIRLRRRGWQRLDAAVAAARETLARGPVAGPLTPQPALRSEPHETERLAALDALPSVGSETRWVLDCIAESSDRGCTIDDVHARWEAERPEPAPAPNQLQARRWDLATKHNPPWVVPKRWQGAGERLIDDHRWGRVSARPTRKGSLASVWVLSEPAKRRLAAERGTT